MNIKGKSNQSLYFDENDETVRVIDQTLLPHRHEVIAVDSLEACCEAISAMRVRGAPLIGVTAAFGIYLALRDRGGADEVLREAIDRLRLTRPTAVNLSWALDKVAASLQGVEPTQRAAVALETARNIQADDAAACSAIGDFGLEVLQQVWKDKREGVSQRDSSSPLNILTHCNAGWLATADWGTALAPIYKAWEKGVPVHVWVDETRPRLQGASLTAWELQQMGVPHTVISDNAGGHLMQHGRVDLCLVGSDRTTAGGDVCNKIGTYLKALAAFDNAIPFYVALPLSSIDFSMEDGMKGIPIEERHGDEVASVQGVDESGEYRRVQLIPEGSAVANYGFDVTPSRLVSALITEKGVFPASRQGLAQLRRML